MEAEEDHYLILGLPSGEEGSKLTIEDIKKAYRAKARECHPDKRLNDPLAKSQFQKLQSSFEILKDENARKAFDDLLRVKRERVIRERQLDSKRRKLTSDLEERERAAFEVDQDLKVRDEEERIAKKLKEEISRIRAMNAKKTGPGAIVNEDLDSSMALEKDKALKVSWEKDGESYTAARLKEIFERFGTVEDVVILSKGTKKRRSALVVMASKEASAAALQNMSGSFSSHLHVHPIHQTAENSSNVPPIQNPNPSSAKLSNLVGAGYEAFEDSILKKLQKDSLFLEKTHLKIEELEFRICNIAYFIHPLNLGVGSLVARRLLINKFWWRAAEKQRK